MAITKRPRQLHVTKKAQSTVKDQRLSLRKYSIDTIGLLATFDGTCWQLKDDFLCKEYIDTKCINDDLDDERLALEEQLRWLELSDKAIAKIRRRLRKINKLYTVAHKAMSDAWQRIKEGASK